MGKVKEFSFLVQYFELVRTHFKLSKNCHSERSEGSRVCKLYTSGFPPEADQALPDLPLSFKSPRNDSFLDISLYSQVSFLDDSTDASLLIF